MKKIKVKELGNILPSNGLTFSFVPFIGKREKDIYNLMSQLKNGVSNQVRATLSILLDEVGQVAFPPYSQLDNPIEKRLKLFDSLDITIGDAYYMYLKARIESFGDELKITLGCPVCKEKTDYTINLSELNVNVCDGSETSKIIDLKMPVVLLGKEYTQAEIRPVKFGGDFYESDNISDSQISVVSLNTKLVGYDFPLSQEQVEEFPISVQRQLYSEIDNITAGLSELLSFTCANCKRVAPYIMSWEYPLFFA